MPQRFSEKKLMECIKPSNIGSEALGELELSPCSLRAILHLMRNDFLAETDMHEKKKQNNEDFILWKNCARKNLFVANCSVAKN